jgi:hypothetical protein
VLQHGGLQLACLPPESVFSDFTLQERWPLSTSS